MSLMTLVKAVPQLLDWKPGLCLQLESCCQICLQQQSTSSHIEQTQFYQLQIHR